MAGSIEAKLRKLEGRRLGVSLWCGFVVDWMDWIRGSPYLNWVFQSESHSPAIFTEFERGSPPTKREWPSLSRSWLDLREDLWVQRCWRYEWEDSAQGSKLWYYRLEGDPVTPPRPESLKSYSVIARTIPPGAFIWARSYRQESRKRPASVPEPRGIMDRFATDIGASEGVASYAVKSLGPLTRGEAEAEIEKIRPGYRDIGRWA